MEISDATVNLIKQEIIRLTGSAIESTHLELQDDGRTLLIQMCPKAGSTVAENQNVLALVRELVKPLIPPRQGDVSWMAVIGEGGRVDDAVQSEIL